MFLRGIVFSMVALVLASTGCAKEKGFYEPASLGKKAPGLVLETLSGAKGDLLEMIKAKPAVVVFWATWCPHCREQLSEIYRSREALKAEGVSVILVNVGEDKAAVQSFIKSKDYDFDVLLDVDSKLSELYQVVGIPTIVLIGADGNIRDVQYGFPENYLEILKN